MTDDWIEYRRLILADLEQLRGATEKLTEEVTTLNKRLVALEVKAGVWGAVAGAIVMAGIKLLGD